MFELRRKSIKKDLIPGSKWLLNNSVNGYKSIESNELATEAIVGRRFEITFNPHIAAKSNQPKRIKVRLLEDGYICWLELKDIESQIEFSNNWTPSLLTRKAINHKIPKILSWIEHRSKKTNHYLWGGTVGPNFDCSGLIQTAFAIEGIWLPRDAYQQEEFCENIELSQSSFKELIPGDLLFFGDKKRCSHVAIYIGKGAYWHSSGKQFGRDGIGRDNLLNVSNNAISYHYLSILRGAGRVVSCHDGTSLS